SARYICPRLGSSAESAFGTAGLLGILTRCAFAEKQPARYGESHDQRNAHGADRRKHHAISADKFLKAIHLARRSRDHRLLGAIPLEIRSQARNRVITPAAVFLERLHHNPVEVALEQRSQTERISLPLRSNALGIF